MEEWLLLFNGLDLRLPPGGTRMRFWSATRMSRVGLSHYVVEASFCVSPPCNHPCSSVQAVVSRNLQHRARTSNASAYNQVRLLLSAVLLHYRTPLHALALPDLSNWYVPSHLTAATLHGAHRSGNGPLSLHFARACNA
jgi:hypothetical protein